MLFQLTNHRERAQEKSPHYPTLSHLLGKNTVNWYLYGIPNQRGRGAQSPSCQSHCCRLPTSRSISGAGLFCKTTRLGAHLPASWAACASTLENSGESLSVQVPSGWFQNNLWVVPFCTQYIGLLSHFREWGYTHSPSAAERKHHRLSCLESDIIPVTS